MVVEEEERDFGVKVLKWEGRGIEGTWRGLVDFRLEMAMGYGQ